MRKHSCASPPEAGSKAGKGALLKRLHLVAILFAALWILPYLAQAQDPDIEANEQRAREEYFRTSEQPGETPTNARQRQGGKRVSPPPGAARVGCICMDDTPSDATSIGACSGHGGVRYWLYLQPNGDTVRVTTARHERHPHPLDSIERSELVKANAKKRRSDTSSLSPTVIIVQMPTPPDDNPFTNPSWPEAIAILGLGGFAVWAAYLLLLWSHHQIPHIAHALRDYLRHRRRPPEDENG
ncbi:MAG: hypothetical protein RMJ33_14185 [Saprospiraceae bacterium]|nr:hypothetical protein [Saprospiraceae bacterium]MDW8230979.1 hypothetical protein [Saprospiraceae bacterium]